MSEKIPEDEFIKLVMRYHDDDLSDEELAKFNEALKNSPEHVKLFNDINLQFSHIINYGALEVGYENNETPEPKIITVEKNTLSKLLAIAALLAVSLVSLAVILKPDKKSSTDNFVEVLENFPAKITAASADLLWEKEEKNLSTGDGLEKGWYRLKQGTLDVVFESGAEVSIKGPAYFAVVSSMQSFLEYGDVSVYAPESARNFTIKAPTMDVVDLGTKFSLSINPEDGESKVNVTEGLVNLHLKSPSEEKRLQSLAAGSKANLDSNGKLLSVEGESKPSLLAHYTFDDLKGGVVKDSSGNDLPGQLVGKMENLLTEGVAGKALDLSGEQYVDISSHLQKLPKNHFTVSAWVKNPVNMVFSMSDGTKHNRLQFERYKNRVLYGWQKGKFFDPIYAIVDWEDNKWYHMAFTYSGGHISLYRDGVELTSNTQGRLNTRALGPIDFSNLNRAHIGVLVKGTPSKPFPDSIQKLMGQIDDFQIYSSALTPEQMKFLYENPGKAIK